MVILTPIEREILQVCFTYFIGASTFGNTIDIYAIIHLVPHACQHIMVDPSHSRGDTVAKILRFTERHIWYYCLLQENQGNYVHGLFLETKLREFAVVILKAKSNVCENYRPV
jgi:hypothetical protein